MSTKAWGWMMALTLVAGAAMAMEAKTETTQPEAACLKKAAPAACCKTACPMKADDKAGCKMAADKAGCTMKVDKAACGAAPQAQPVAETPKAE